VLRQERILVAMRYYQMKKLVTIGIVMLMGLFSCKNAAREKELIQKEEELAKKEKELEAESKEMIEKVGATELNSTVQLNLIHCENDKYTIRVDRLKSNEVRYMAWNKPKSNIDKPDLILLDGEIEKQGSGGGYHFTFTNGDMTYVIENNLMGESIDSMGVFLRILDNGKEKMYSKMKDLKN